MRKTYATWADALSGAGRSRPVSGTGLEGPGRAGWDDLRLVGLKLIYLILMLRHQLAVAQRERPRAHSRLAWPDRAWLALLAGTLPIERLTAMLPIVTPATILRWHRDIVRRRWARVSHRGGSGRRRCAATCGL